jgi:hypothetical protein
MPVYSIWCPRGEDCSRGGKTLARGANVDDLRARLLQHLSAAPGHADLLPEEREELARVAEVQRWDTGGDDESAALPIGARKRRRTAAASSADGAAAADEGQERLNDNMLTDISAAVALGIQEGVATALQPVQQTAPPMPEQPATPPPGAVVLPAAVVSGMIDHLVRAEQASRQAGRISATAANAFESEANSIASARLHIEAHLLRQRR